MCIRDKLFEGASISFFLCFAILRYCLRINCNYVTVFFLGEKNGKIKIAYSFSTIKMCFVINVFNDKTIILLNLAEYPLILAKRGWRGIVLTCFSQIGLRPRRLSIKWYSTRFRRIIDKYPMGAKPMKTLELHYPMIQGYFFFHNLSHILQRSYGDNYHKILFSLSIYWLKCSKRGRYRTFGSEMYVPFWKITEQTWPENTTCF